MKPFTPPPSPSTPSDHSFNLTKKALDTEQLVKYIQSTDVRDPGFWIPQARAKGLVHFQAVYRDQLSSLDKYPPLEQLIATKRQKRQVHMRLDRIAHLNNFRPESRDRIAYYAWISNGDAPPKDPADDCSTEPSTDGDGMSGGLVQDM